MNTSGSELRTYLFVYIALLALLALTIGAALVPLGGWNTAVNMTIAVAQALLVLIFFMRLRDSSGLQRVVAAVGFVWLSMLFGLTLTDYLTRMN